MPNPSNTCFHITKYTYPIRQIPAFISSNTHIHITAYAFPPPLRVYLRICGRDKSDPYSCWRIAIMLLTVCNNAANKLQYTHIHPRNTILSHRKNHTFAPQKPYFRTAKTILLHYKNHTFTPQKPYFYTANTHFSHRKYLSATNWEGRKNVLLKSSL